MSDRPTDDDRPPSRGPTPSIDELVANEDADGLIDLGTIYRVGSETIEQDLFKALPAFAEELDKAGIKPR